MKDNSERQYLRIGEVPPDGVSKIHNPIDNSIIGKELGVSVFEYIEGRGVVVPDNQKARDDFMTLMKSWWKPQYIVSGEEIGIGCDGEPILKNVKIIKILKKAKTEDIEESENSQKSFYEEFAKTPPEYGIVVLERCAKEADKLQAEIKDLKKENKRLTQEIIDLGTGTLAEKNYQLAMRAAAALCVAANKLGYNTSELTTNQLIETFLKEVKDEKVSSNNIKTKD